MTVFGEYAKYYDLMYQAKDFEGEAEYVQSLVRDFNPTASSLLDLGCGSGHHAEAFLHQGYRVTGLDRSQEMIAIANSRMTGIDFHQADLCQFHFEEQFDVITALFHVVSYLTHDHQLQALFDNVKKQLSDGGVFIFDCWHGPAVEHQLPELRVSRFQQAETRICRIAEPRITRDKHRVTVDYQMFVYEDRHWREFTETHPMRYLFQSDIEDLSGDHGLQVLLSQEWMTGKDPGRDTWGVVYVIGAQ